LRSHPATTKRLGDSLEIVAKKEVPTLAEAQEIERSLKRKKNLKLAIYHFTTLEKPRKHSGLVQFSLLAGSF